MCTKAVRAGRFREDLFCQLNVIPIYKPPLNERKDDIILPADYYLKIYAVEYKRAFIGLKAEQMKRTSLDTRMRTLGKRTSVNKYIADNANRTFLNWLDTA